MATNLSDVLLGGKRQIQLNSSFREGESQRALINILRGAPGSSGSRLPRAKRGALDNLGKLTADGPNVFAGLGVSLQPQGFNLGLDAVLGTTLRNRERELRNQRIQKTSRGREELKTGKRTLETLEALPSASLTRQKLNAGGTLLVPAATRPAAVSRKTNRRLR